jgi:hypothetical protein
MSEKPTLEQEISQKLSQKLEHLLFEQISGPVRKQRQTALRLHGRSFETVELDDAGNVIEPIRCICGSFAVIHRPNCPFNYMVT